MKTLIEFRGINIYVMDKKNGVLSVLLPDARKCKLGSRDVCLPKHLPVIFTVDSKGKELAPYRHFQGLVEIDKKTYENRFNLVSPVDKLTATKATLPSVGKKEAKAGATCNLLGRIDIYGGRIKKVAGPCLVVGWDTGTKMRVDYPKKAVVQRLKVELVSDHPLSLRYKELFTGVSESFELPEKSEGRTRIGNHCAEDLINWGVLSNPKVTGSTLSIDYDFEWLWSVLNHESDAPPPLPTLKPSKKDPPIGGCEGAECNGSFAKIGS